MDDAFTDPKSPLSSVGKYATNPPARNRHRIRPMKLYTRRSLLYDPEDKYRWKVFCRDYCDAGADLLTTIRDF